MNIFKFELYRAFNSRMFLISLVIGFSICTLDLVTFYSMFGLNDRVYLIQAWIGADYQFAYNMMFYTLLPVLACLPFGGSLHTDIKTGYYKNICILTSRNKYILSKAVAVFLTGFACIVIPLTLNLFFVAGLFPNYLPERLQFNCIGIYDANLFADIFRINPAIYCLIFILIDGLFGGVIALTSLSIATFVKSRFSAVVTPMVFL